MTDKTVSFNNFIGVYDGYITEQECDRAIKLFEDQNKFNNTLNRLHSEQTSVLKKQDQQLFTGAGNMEMWWEELKSMIVNFDLAWNHYIENTGAKDGYGKDKFYYTNLKIQKTLPTEGYHVWHVEHGENYIDAIRAFVYTIYLNDVEEGGETEFLHFSKRVKPKKGRIVIWPAGFPYLHRGNPPLSGDGKYILTSWMNLK
jgi:hypothetical protein|tara:strand:- start:4005 stop:4604 length:600 start_codon:yes stop_codon:yes gene_type:complete